MTTVFPTSPSYTYGVNFTNVLRAAFMCLRFRFRLLYWRKTVSAKAAFRMLVKFDHGYVKLLNLMSLVNDPKYQNLQNQLLDSQQNPNKNAGMQLGI
jgi:hypothetical protein